MKKKIEQEKHAALKAIKMAENNAEENASDSEPANGESGLKDWFIGTSDKWADKITDLFEDLEQEGTN